eukprot:COSAG06_NODE_172_length_21346_cov_503.127053_16_plen_141_part_00
MSAAQDMPSDAATYKVFAFYKGSAFPMLLSVTMDDWATYKRTADECIVMGLRMGDSITQQSDIHMQLLDKVEACMYATEAAKRSWTAQHKLDDLCKTLGHDILTIKSMWYQAILCLERFGTLKTDNNQNGFVFVRESSSD